MGDTYHALFNHFLWSTKHREPAIVHDIQHRLYEYIGGVVRELDGSLLAVGGVADHIHLLIKLLPKHAPSDVARVIKCNSSKWLHELDRKHAHFDWQDGYTVFSVSKSGVEEVRAYIARQEEHHKQRSFIDELTLFLEKHGVDYDPKYLL